jgi:diguanylate cyclase (GGDEF)-like protein
VTALFMLGTTLLAYRASRKLDTVARQLENDRQMIEDLRLHDPKTGLVRFQYARQTLKLEVMRSQRYHINLSLVLLDMANRKALEDKYGMIGLEEINNQIAGILLSATREVDTCFINGKVGVILPQTNPDGACIVAERVIGSAARRLSIDLYAGIAYFPRDAVSEDDLIRSAESALQVALTSGRSVVYYSQIQEGLEGGRGPNEAEKIEGPQ